MKISKLMACALALLMLAGLALPALAQESILQKGDTGERVTALQARLKELDYLDGDSTGIFDEETEQALLAGADWKQKIRLRVGGLWITETE